MSQPSVTAFFNTRKRQATDDVRSRAKVLVLEHEKTRTTDEVNKATECEKIIESSEQTASPKIVYKAGESKVSDKANSVIRNIQFDVNKAPSSPKAPKMLTRARATKARKFSAEEGQTDIRESFLKLNNETNKDSIIVPFEKRGLLSPKKNFVAMNSGSPVKVNNSRDASAEQPAVGSTTPKKSSYMDRLAKQDLSLGEIKNRIHKSSRLAELKDRIDKFKRLEQKLENFNKDRDEVKPPKIKKFEKIELEVPVSPQKAARSPMKTPTKNIQLPSTASPQRRILFEPKEAPSSPVKSSPTKVPAYQRYQSLIADKPTYTLPFNYRFLAEAFRCVDTVAAMLFNRKEVITFKKLRPAVQELLRRNFSLEHLGQIKTIYPDAYIFSQEKMRNFGSASKQEKFELCLKPNVEEKNGRNTPDADDVLKSASEMSMGPGVLLARRRKFYDVLIDRVKLEHEKFLLNLESPMIIPKEKITRWHPEFDVESCVTIEQAELPQPPHVEKASSAKDVLEKAKTFFSCNTRMEKALQRLAESKMTSRSELSPSSKDGQDKVETSVVDTPPATPTCEKTLIDPKLKGIPKALLERIRAKQAAKALEAMTRTPTQDKEAALYSRLPEMSKILRNIFVAEKKGVLTLEHVIDKMDNSYRTKLTPNELEEHIKLMCKLLPTWVNIHNVRKTDYLKLAKDTDIAKVVKKFELMANDKVEA